MQLRTDEVDLDKLDGGDFPDAGSYHFEVLEFMESDPRNGSTWFDAEVLAGSVKGQEGKIHREYVNWRTAINIALALKLTTVEELSQHKAAGTQPEVGFDQHAVGRQFCGTLEPEEYRGKTRNKLSFRVFAVDSPKAKGIPLNKAKLAEFNALLQTAGDDPFGNPTPAAGQGQQPAAAEATTAESGEAGELSANDLF